MRSRGTRAELEARRQRAAARLGQGKGINEVARLVGGAHQENARRLNATVVFYDESGLRLRPLVRRSWALRGQAPILRGRDWRDRLSVIRAITAPPSGERHRLDTVFCIHTMNITTPEATEFLGVLDRHVRRPKIVLQDRLNVHRAAVKPWLAG